jgi:hypothetical protein
MQRRPAFKAVLARSLVVRPGLPTAVSTRSSYIKAQTRRTYPDLHLLSAVDEPLLDGWDTFFFFHALFYL